MAFSRSARRLLIALVPLALGAAVIVFWQWDWFVPMVNSRASAAIGRPVSIEHLHVKLGRTTRIVADGVLIPNPDGFPEGDPFLRLAHLGVDLDVEAYVRRRELLLPVIDLDQPVIAATGTTDGQTNYIFHFTGSGQTDSASAASAGPSIGKLSIVGGYARVLIPKFRTDATAEIATQDSADEDSGGARLVVDAKGTYAAQPVSAKLIAGSLLSLRDSAKPYPIDLKITNGPTSVSLVGTVQDPVAFAGADLKLALAGPDMALLTSLTGIPLPKTPPYKITGLLDYADRKIRFKDFVGTVGKSDIDGTIAVDPGKERPEVTAVLHSKFVDLQDLGGLIGSEPGRSDDPGMSAAQRQAVAKAEASSQLVPNTPINLPKLKSADLHIQYTGSKIQGRNMPFDTVGVTADLVDGNVSLRPLTLGVGTGQIKALVDLQPSANDQIHAKADIQLQRLDVSRMLAATHATNGAGRLGGSASIETNGNSLAGFLAGGDGKLDLYMSGGDLNAVLVDLSGLQFGKAMLSALGMPAKADLRCLIGQFALQKGVLRTRTMLIDTSEAVISGRGDIDLAHEKLDYEIKTESKHFSIGSLPAPIGITGTFKNPSIGPDLAKLGARGGAAVGLGLLLPPLALLPTIQLGVGDDNRCAGLLRKK